METLTRFIHEDEGQNLVEYALLAGLVALVVMTAVTSVGGSISGLYTRLATKINGIAP
jgi:pilus assembly protein Flp/PilA